LNQYGRLDESNDVVAWPAFAAVLGDRDRGQQSDARGQISATLRQQRETGVMRL